MLMDNYDAFGGRSPHTGLAKREASNTSAGIARAGRYAFWLLIVVIVGARIVWYPVSPRFDVGSASDSRQVVTR
jgi:hypothetical protein